MADVSDEIDEFAIFKARSLGAESEYLVLAKAGQLRGRDARTAFDSEYNKRGGHWSGARQQRNILSGRCGNEAPSPNSPREDSCSPKVRRGAAPPYARSDSTKTETLDTRNELLPLDEEEEEEKGRLHRAHSYRSRRSSPQPQSSQLPLLLPIHGGQSESKLNRSRTMTMPTRRRPTLASAAAAGATGSHSPARRSGSRSSFRGGDTVEANGGSRTPSSTSPAAAAAPSAPGEQPVVDRAVLRVRNFSTKSGNIVNRGDSIKVRGGRGEFRSGSMRSLGGGGGGTPRVSRPPSAKDDCNGAVAHGDASPSPSRPSLSRHSSRGSCKIYTDPEFISSSPVDGGGWGAADADQPLTGSTPSAHSLLSPIGYQKMNGEEQAPDDPQINTHLQVFGDCNQRGRGSRPTPKADPGADEEVAVYRVLVLGSQGVGKTTLTQQLLTSEYLANNDSNDIGE